MRTTFTGSIGGLNAGAGDLYWDPLDVLDLEPFPDLSVANDTELREQRNRMLDCSAASMLEMYRWAGPRAGPGATDASLALSRMFWRGNLQRTCRLVEDDPDLLYELEQRCTDGALTGGDAATWMIFLGL